MLGLGKNRTRLFYKYLISYIIIFLIPFMLISVVFYQMSVSSIQDEIEQSNKGKLEQVKDMADARLDELQQIAHRISMDHRLTPYMFTEPYYSKLAINELTTYSVNSSIVDSLFLYYYGQENIYSSRGVNTIDVYTDVYRFASYEIEQLKREMETIERPTVRAFDLESASEHVIAYMFPIASTSVTPYGTVVFLVKEDIFTNVIHHALGHFEGNIYIFNRDQEKIASYHNSESTAIVDAELLSQLDSGITRKRLNGEDYSLVSTYSDDSQWTFVTAMPTEQFYAKMDAMKSTIMTILSIIAIIGIVSTFYMAVMQYRPIHVLNQKIKTMHGKYFSKQTKDEIAHIQESFQMMHENSEQLQQKMKVHEPFLRDQIVLKLINGDVITLKEQAELLEDLHMNFHGKRNFIFVVSLKEQHVQNETLHNKENVLQYLQELSLENSTGYGVELIHDQAVGVIVDMQDDEQDLFIQRHAIMEAIINELSRITTMELRLGIGGIYEELSRMNRSFIEAKAAIDYALIHNNSQQPVYFEEIASQTTRTLWFQSDQQVKLVQSLKQGDAIVAKESVKNLLSELNGKDTSIYMLKTMCFDLINTILKSASEARIQYDLNQVRMMVEFESLNRLEQAMGVFISELCNEVKRNKLHLQNELKDQVLTYIHQNYTSHSISLEQIAEKFRLSSSYVSRMIKEQTGHPFTKYIWKLRMEECKRQLRDTTLPIKEIVQKVGYLDVANFIRKFRKEEGVTPGQYRKNVVLNHSSYGK